MGDSKSAESEVTKLTFIIFNLFHAVVELFLQFANSFVLSLTLLNQVLRASKEPDIRTK